MPELVDTKLIDGTARTVRELFSGRKYGLDFYQREYTWTESNVSELIDDLTTRFLDDFDEDDERSKVAGYRPYFLGPIVTSSGGGIRYIVDGQQRLTTLTLLLIHLNQLSEGVQGAENLSPLVYSTQYGSATFNIDVDERDEVMKAILHQREFDPNGVSESVRTIWERYQNIVEMFPDDLKGDALVYFTDWLLERVVLVDIGTTDQDMALEIFETMNDRGLRLSNADMLKGFVLARIEDPDAIEAANHLWRQRITELADLEKNADAEFLKHWLRGKFAETIRERKKDAVPRDFDLIGTAFHKWVRDNREKVGLNKAGDFAAFVNRDFERMSGRYSHLLLASQTFQDGWEHVFYNASTGFTLQYLPIMAAVTPGDDDDTFRRKSTLIASYLDLMVARRMVNNRNFGYSTVVYTMFNLAKDLRDRDLDELHEILADRVADLPEQFDAVMSFRLTQRNRSHIHYLLARITAYIEDQVGGGVGFSELVDRGRKKPFEVEHIWADHYERHTDEFAHAHEFDEYRNRFGDLLLLPKDFNASYGDKPYDVKLEHYYGQNILAKSLHPRAYQHNPSFVRFVQEAGLHFQPHPEFLRDDLDARQDLYRQLCELVWDPDQLGLGGGTPSDETSKENRRAFYGVNLNDLFEAGLVSAGENLTGNRSGKKYTAQLTESRKARTPDGNEYETLSGAADALTGRSNNGWEFWSVQRPEGAVRLASLRTHFLNTASTDIPKG